MLVEEEILSAANTLDESVRAPIINPDYEDNLIVESLEETP